MVFDFICQLWINNLLLNKSLEFAWWIILQKDIIFSHNNLWDTKS